MKINPLLTHILCSKKTKKALRIMKLSFLIIFISVCQLYAVNGEAQNAVVELKSNRLTVGELFEAIEKQTDYLVVYSDGEVNRNAELNLKKSRAKVTDYLNDALRESGLKYEFVNTYIILSKVEKSQATTQTQKTVTGVVTDQKGEPIAGVNVVEKGTINGTITDGDGQFSLQVSPNTKLQFSYIGYTTLDIPVAGKNTLKVVLTEDAKSLDEVVVTALGISRSTKAIGYAMDKLGGDQIAIAGQPNMALGLAGKVSGVQVAASSSGMDGTPRVIIRGISSLSNDNSPLWVINGIPQQTNRVLNESLWAPSSFNDWGNPMSDINPNDIEEMTVLKGAAATALYGSRASNGAILVTTKKGAKGQKGWNVTLNQTTTFSNPLVLPTYQTKYGMGSGGEYEYVDGKGNGKGEYGDSYGPTFIDPATGTFRQVAQYNSPIDPVTGKRVPTDFKPYADNYDNFFQTGSDVNTTVAVSYVNEVSNTRISLSHNKVRDIVPNSALQRISGNVNSSMQIGKRLKADVMMLMSQMDSPNRTGQGSGGVMEDLISFPTSIDIRSFRDKYKNEQGDPISWTDTGKNPYWNVYENLNPSVRNKFTGKIGFTFEFMKELNIQANLYNDYNSTNYERITAKWKHDGGSYRTGNNLNKEYNADVTVNFNKQIKNFALAGNVATSIRNEQAHYRSSWTDGGLLKPNIYNLNNSRLEAKTNYEFIQKEVQSVSGYLDVSYKNFLYLTLTGRNDWSSTLPKSDWSYFYPSVSASFVFTELLKDKKGILSFGKIRANWAKVGNDTGAYQLLRYVSRGSDWTSADGKEPVLNFENLLPPVGLKPEQKTSWELGADLRFLNNRIALDVAYFNDESKNQIIKTETPWEGGGRHRMVNAGLLKTTGLEIKLDARVFDTKDFTWDIAVNWSTNRTKVVELYPGVDFLHLSAFNGIEVRAMPGQRYGEIWGFVNITDNQDFWDNYVNKYPWMKNLVGENVQPYGTGKDLVKDGMPINTVWMDDVPLKKYTTPDWMAGMTNTFRYKDFDMSFTLDWRKGGYIASSSMMTFIQSGKDFSTIAPNVNGVNIREPIKDGGGLIYDGTDIETGKPNTTPINAEGYFNAWNTPTTKILYKGDYIKLRDLTIGYRIPKQLLGSLGVSNVRLAFVGRNLWLIKSYLPGFDPETSSMGSGNSGMGVENYSMPSTRNLGFNVQIEF